MPKRVLLDTGLLLGLTRGASWAVRADADLDLSGAQTLAFTSAICRGELLALAEKRGWGADRRGRMNALLDLFPTVGINRPSILSAYAAIDAWTHGRAVESPANTPPPKPAVPMKQNDLWIAATANASEAVLVSTDRHFVHLVMEPLLSSQAATTREVSTGSTWTHGFETPKTAEIESCRSWRN